MKSKLGKGIVAEDKSDERLVTEAQSGVSESFDELVRRYQHRVYAIAYRMVYNREDALDICQETFIRAYGSLPKYRPSGSFRQWLFTIATNLSIDHLRRVRRRPSQAVEDQMLDLEALSASLLSTDGPAREVYAREIGAAIRLAVDGLSDKQKTVFVMRYYEGLSLKEISEIIDCTLGSVKVHLFRATRKLRNELEWLRALDREG
jgi:RNA polymerase sigma-70 factor (ECF subfamily)